MTRGMSVKLTSSPARFTNVSWRKTHRNDDGFKDLAKKELFLFTCHRRKNKVCVIKCNCLKYC